MKSGFGGSGGATPPGAAGVPACQADAVAHIVTSATAEIMGMDTPQPDPGC